MQKITPHLWFNREAKEAAEFYAGLIPQSRIGNITTLHNTPSGDCDVVSFQLAGQPFMAISAGPLFKFNPSVSFHLNCRTPGEVDAMWEKISPGGNILMPLGPYPFSARYGWVEDKYGLSWQVISAGESATGQMITPMLMFVGRVCGKAEEAMAFYTSVFGHSLEGGKAAGGTKADILARYGKGEEPDKEGTVKYASFALLGQEFRAMDSAWEHHFAFNEALSFMVPCETQEEIDYFWGKLSADPQAEQCGWLKDKYGLSWQVTPTVMNEMLGSRDKERIARVTEAFLKMKKFDIAALKRAYESK
jgi:predicted 3-demethylubiquinone-9 3-methyltransferase (glyoxalase superfamily)